LSASHNGRLYPQEVYLVLIFTRVMVRSEGNMSLKNPVTQPGIDPGTLRLVAQRLDHYATPGPNTEKYLYCNRVHCVNTAFTELHINRFYLLPLSRPACIHTVAPNLLHVTSDTLCNRSRCNRRTSRDFTRITITLATHVTSRCSFPAVTTHCGCIFTTQ
jgi:hypothetical protein